MWWTAGCSVAFIFPFPSPRSPAEAEWCCWHLHGASQSHGWIRTKATREARIILLCSHFGGFCLLVPSQILARLVGLSCSLFGHKYHLFLFNGLNYWLRKMETDGHNLSSSLYIMYIIMYIITTVVEDSLLRRAAGTASQAEWMLFLWNAREIFIGPL